MEMKKKTKTRPLPPMKIPRTLCSIALLACAARGVEPAAPTPHPADRYAVMSARSPFAIATAAPAPPEASFAANWYVSGIARLGDADFVTIKSRDAALQFSLFGQEANTEHGVSVASVNWSDTLGKSTVILKKGTETAKLEFNEAEMRGPALAPAPAAAAKGPAKPGAPVNLGAPLKPGATLPPVVTPPTALEQFPPGQVKPGEVRRRARIIPVPQ